MAIVKFRSRVKYGYTFYDAHTPFECSDSDLQALLDAGGERVDPPAQSKALPKKGKTPRKKLKAAREIETDCHAINHVTSENEGQP